MGGLSSAFLPIHKDAVTRVGREAHELREPAAQQTNSPEAQSASAPSLPNGFQRRLLPGGRSPGEAGSAARPRPRRAAASARGSSRGSPDPRCHRGRGRVGRGARRNAQLVPDSTRPESPRRWGPSGGKAGVETPRPRPRPSTKAGGAGDGRSAGTRPAAAGAARPQSRRPAARRVQAVRSVPASLSPPCPCLRPRASPGRGPSRPPRALPARDFLGRRAEAPPAPLPLSLCCGPRGAGARAAAAGGSALPLRLITPSAILSVLPRSSPGPWARPGSQTAPEAPPREWRPAAGAPRPPPAPARHFGGRLVSLHLPAGSAGAYWLVLHWPTGSSPWALSPQGRSYQHATKRRAPLEGPALKRVFLGLLAFIPTAPSQESES